MRLRLVHAASANRFMRDILEGIAVEVRDLGVDAQVVDDVFDPADDVAYVVIPHEYFAVREPELWPSRAQLGRTIALTVEHPGTPWFEISDQQSRRCAAVVDINRDSAAEMRRRGHKVKHFQLGYSRHWDAWGGLRGERSTDIVYLGSTDDRRDKALAGFSSLWWNRRVKMLLPTTQPKPTQQPDFVVGRPKFEMLADSKVLLNLHRLDSNCLEWVRVLEAMSNGCVVVSEHSVDAGPLVAGEHYLSGSIGSLGVMAAAALEEPDRLAQMRESAYQFIRTKLPMKPAAEMLVDLATQLVAKPRTVPDPKTIAHPPRPAPLPPGWPEGVVDRHAIGAGLDRIENRLRRTERALARLELGLAPGDPTVVDVFETGAYGEMTPDVSVLIPVYNHATEIKNALDSVAACDGVDFEILVQDDGSTDDSAAVVEEWMREHWWIAARLFRNQLNSGPSQTRNDLLAAARADMVFLLDADNGVYPPALSRLRESLLEDAEADFAYAPIATMRFGAPFGLVSERPWMPHLLRHGNYIDNMAMHRTQSLRDIGGWDNTMFGVEDFHLWARLAEAGRRGAFVPQVLSWYSVTDHSNTISAALGVTASWSRIRAAAPTLMHD